LVCALLDIRLNGMSGIELRRAVGGFPSAAPDHIHDCDSG
jgi:hypothetical protein